MIDDAEIIVNAPGRVCLFGDHQDYLNLPVIACAIDRFVKIKAIPNELEILRLELPDINASRSFHINEEFNRLEKGDYFASVFRVVKRYGCVPNRGYDITITGQIPINAGLSSSSAAVVCWTRFLLNTFGCEKEITNNLIARIAYESEVVEHNSPGGRMDQYTIALGDIIFLETDDKTNYKKIGNKLEGLIIGESEVPKNTLKVLSNSKEKTLRSIEIIQEYAPNFDLSAAILSDVKKYSHLLSKELKPFFYATVKNYMITQDAYKVLTQPIVNYFRVGYLMNEHHSVLKNALKITTPKIDKMIDAAINAGAYGAKIVGSGGGGSICALASKEKQQDVIDSIATVGKKSYAVKVTSSGF